MSTFEILEHRPYCAGHTATKAQNVCGFGTPGETVAFSFSIESAEDIAEIRISTTSLAADEASIDQSSIEVYVVKLWDVSGVGVHQSKRMTVAELLLKDDRAPLNDGYIEHPAQGLGSAEPLWLYNPPDVRLTGDANTSLVAGEPKQIWLSVKIPVTARATKYTGSVKIETSQGDFDEMPVLLEVLPFTLQEPTQDLMLWYRGSMDPQQAQFYVSPELFRVHLQDIYDHGFRSISICEEDRARAQLAIDIAEDVGFNRQIVFRQIPFNAEALRFSKLTPVYYLSDEMDAQLLNSGQLSESSVTAHRGHGDYCAILNWASMASLVSDQFVKRLDDNQDIGYRPTVVSLVLSGNKEFFRNGGCSTLKAGQTYYHWQSHMEKPNLHRVLAGSYLWKTGVGGIAPYCYQHPPIFPFSPFDDFDAWEPFLQTEKFRDRMTTYPARAGVIPTLQWEGLREGINDLRYLTTLERVLALAETLNSQEAKALASDARDRRDKFLSRISIDEIDIDSTIETEPYKHIAAQEYHDFRKQIALDIVELYAHIHGSTASTA